MATEKRLIDRNEIFPNGTFFANAENPLKSLDELIARIWRINVVDAVEVVRCKDCKYWGQDVCSSTGEDESFCTNPDGLDNYAHPDDFCSYGERRTE